MRILLVTDTFLPHTNSAARAMHELAGEFSRQGHTVSVLTSTRDIHGDVAVEQEQGFEVIRVNAGKVIGSGRLSRAISEILLPFECWWRGRAEIRKHLPDILVFYSPSIFWGWLVGKIKNESGCYTYLILRDMFPQWAIDLGLLRAISPVTLLFRLFERWQYAVADCIGVQSPANLGYFEKRRANSDNTQVLWNWIVRGGSTVQSRVTRESLGLVDKCLFCYGGNIGIAQRMDALLDIATRLEDSSNAHFLIVGDGSERKRLSEKLAALSLSNVTMLPPLPQAEFDELLTWIDVGLVLLDPKLGTHNIPGKLLNYCAAGKPVIAQVNPGNDLIDVVHRYGAGLASPGDESAFMLNIQLLAADAEMRAQCGRNGKRLAAELFSVERAAKQILGARAPL